MYGFDYFTASDATSLAQGLENIYDQNDKPVILEVFTPTLKNDAILLQFFNELV
jgi:2-succinyl-5-enolpyruvyl-6-hydroxy-3-cyclohexene-1-carboxylate synthase